ncbi:putative protein SUPPRESSOR OF GENE SILENCING 3 [Cocos nucifera]|uniref:XS domain-containing protein n=1 Tax=Cocos nucifera TaxID=13894 RepID=A0A8K0ND30_COCNU|nr:putative protein SUPPRESSOR OF GENE SILENCING 3 [Cocos nucifera]
MRPRRPGGGSGGGGDGRDVSPKRPTKAKIKDHRSDWRPRRSRRSLSPPRPRWSPSVERRDYASRRSNHGKQHGRRSSPFEDKRYELPPKYIMPDIPPESNPDLNGGSRPSRIFKDKDFFRQGSGAPEPPSPAGIDGQGMLLQKSLFLNDGSSRSYFSLPPDANYPARAAALKSENIGSSSGTLNMGIRDDELLHYRDRMSDPYKEREREKIYTTRDFTSPLIPSSQLRPYGGTSSSGFAKDDLSSLYGDHHHQLSDGYVGSGVKKFLDDPLDRIGYSQGQLTERVRQVHHSPPGRDEPQDYGYHEIWRRERSGHGLLASNDIYKKISWDPRGGYRDSLGSSFLNSTGGRVEGWDASRKITGESSFWDQRRSFHGDGAPKYHELKEVHEDYVGGSGSLHLEFGMKPLRGFDLPSFEEQCALGRDATSMGYRERPKSPVLSDHCLHMYRQDVSPPQGNSRMGDLDIYDLSSERMIRRRYAMDHDVKEIEPRSIVSNDQNAFRRIQSPSGGDEIWPNEDRIGFLPKKNMAFERSPYKRTSRRMSRSAARLLWDDSSAHVDGAHGMSLKRRLRPGPSEFHDSFSSERRQEVFRPYKHWKKGMEDRHSGLNTQGVVPDDDVHLAKPDPPEDSEEFKQQVHKAFLNYSKESKEFGDVHSLVTHTYHSLKVGLRTEHLGLHKALCFLMGWNWLVAPDNSRLYQSRPVAEAKALKEDLILWPPIVIIHNSSIGIKVSSHEPKVVANEGMEERLQEMGFRAGITNVCRGKPANQSMFLIKYKPTLSGLQEAERLHKHFNGSNHGRQELLRITANKRSSESGEARVQMVEDFLFGYMAVVEDLDKLDPETKKRCVIKKMGFRAGITNVCRGKPANQSMFLIKYKPTLSGLQEAERLHKHFNGSNHGRQELLRITANKRSSESGEARVQMVEDFLFGYMAVVEDLDKLDPETKKRCVIKSKKDIEAIADAPLNAD